MSKLPEYVDTLRSSDDKVQTVLAQLQIGALLSKSDRREYPRYPYLVGESMELQIEGGQTRFIVRGRDLSGGGISFLHGTFLYSGQRCIITLRTINGEPVYMRGHIVDCRCVQDRIHVVAMQFDTRITIEEFVHVDRLLAAAAQATAQAAKQPEYPAAYVAELSGRLYELAKKEAPIVELQRVLMSLLTNLHLNVVNNSTQPSATNAQQPEAIAQPAEPNAKPTGAAVKPAEPAAKPAVPVVKPAEPAAKPAGPVVKPKEPVGANAVGN